jgi:predicted nucleic acid-binding protein
MPYIVDTYAWVEYFRGTSKGKSIKDKIESRDNMTPTVVLAELKRKFTEWQRQDFQDRLEFIRDNSQIIDLDERTAILAGEIRAQKPVPNMGLVDCVLLALSRIYSVKVLTGDEHFRKLSEAEFIGG